MLCYQFSVETWQNLVEVDLLDELLQVLGVNHALGFEVKVRRKHVLLAFELQVLQVRWQLLDLVLHVKLVQRD